MKTIIVSCKLWKRMLFEKPAKKIRLPHMRATTSRKLHNLLVIPTVKHEDVDLS